MAASADGSRIRLNQLRALLEPYRDKDTTLEELKFREITLEIPRQELTFEQVNGFGGTVFGGLEPKQVILDHIPGNFDNNSDTLITLQRGNLAQITPGAMLEALDAHPEIDFRASVPPISRSGELLASRLAELGRGQGELQPGDKRGGGHGGIY